VGVKRNSYKGEVFQEDEAVLEFPSFFIPVHAAFITREKVQTIISFIEQINKFLQMYFTYYSAVGTENACKYLTVPTSTWRLYVLYQNV